MQATYRFISAQRFRLAVGKSRGLAPIGSGSSLSSCKVSAKDIKPTSPGPKKSWKSPSFRINQSRMQCFSIPKSISRISQKMLNSPFGAMSGQPGVGEGIHCPQSRLSEELFPKRNRGSEWLASKECRKDYFSAWMTRASRLQARSRAEIWEFNAYRRPHFPPLIAPVRSALCVGSGDSGLGVQAKAGQPS